MSVVLLYRICRSIVIQYTSNVIIVKTFLLFYNNLDILILHFYQVRLAFSYPYYIINDILCIV